MDSYGRHVVVDLDFERALGEVMRALHGEGFQVIARVDIRDHFRSSLRHQFLQYVLLDVWNSESALTALQSEMNLGTILPTTVAVYELNDTETAIVVSDRFGALFTQPVSADAPDLMALVESDRQQMARALSHVLCAASHTASASAA